MCSNRYRAGYWQVHGRTVPQAGCIDWLSRRVLQSGACVRDPTGSICHLNTAWRRSLPQTYPPLRCGARWVSADFLNRRPRLTSLSPPSLQDSQRQAWCPMPGCCASRMASATSMHTSSTLTSPPSHDPLFPCAILHAFWVRVNVAQRTTQRRDQAASC